MGFYTLARDIGLPIKAEKTVYPTSTLTFLGLELNTLKFEVRLPADKLESMKSEIRKFQNKTTASLQELQSLIGLLNFACRVVPPGRPFLRRSINLTMGLKKPKQQKRLDTEAIADLKAWAIFLENFNGKAFFPSGISHSSFSLHLFTDASTIGFGCTFGRKWVFGKLEPQWLNYHISVREFLPIVIAFETWGSTFQNSSVVLHCDDSAVFQVINITSSKDTNLILMRRLMVLSLKNNIHFSARHFPGVYNTAADMLFYTFTGYSVQDALSLYGSRSNPSTSRLPAPLKQAEDQFLRSSLSASTITAYKTAYNTYHNFVCSFFPNQQCLPPSMHHLSAFLAHCYLKGLAAATTRTLVSSLSFVFQLGSYPDITQHFICKKMLQGFHKSKPSRDARLPISPSTSMQ